MFKTVIIPLRAAALAVGITVSSFAGAASAATGDYRFEVLEPQVRPSRDATVVRVRLVRLVEEQPVAGAALNEALLGMWPIQLHKVVATPWMAHAVGQVVAEGGGVYRLPAELTMTGSYRLTLAVRVPGEAEPVGGAVTIRVSHR